METTLLQYYVSKYAQSKNEELVRRILKLSFYGDMEYVSITLPSRFTHPRFSTVLHALEALPFEIDTQVALDITMKSKPIPFRNSHQLFSAITQLESRIHTGNTSAFFSFKYYEVLQRLYISVAFFVDFPKCVESVTLSIKKAKESQPSLSEVMNVAQLC